MVFACQEDSFRKEYKTRVVSCCAAKLDGKAGFEVILEDTILFPEGGGQPDDRGTINGREVLRISRQGDKAVHFLLESIDEGVDVELEVDWARRFDHMQQHSGQHLLSALIENKFGYETTSWELGRLRSHIELDCEKLTVEDMAWIETAANEAIRKKTPVNVHVYSSPSSPGLQEASTRGLPADHVGPVRVIEIEGIDKNMCCGTHVNNLSQVQVIKLFPDLDSKTRGKRLFFIAGDRVLDYLGKSLNNERTFTKMLSCGPDQHVTALERIQSSLRAVNKITKSQLREIAQLEALKLKSSEEVPTYFYVHRENGDMDYMNTIASELEGQGVPVLVTTGPDKGPGQFLLVGQDQQVADLGPRISDLLGGKGGGKKGRYQGKADNLKKRKALGKLLKEHTSTSAEG